MTHRLIAALAATALAACSDSGTNPDPGNNPGIDYSRNCTVTAESDEMRTIMLQLVNAARAAGQMCGSVSMPPAAAVTWDCRLEEAAFNHSTDMVDNDFFDHAGSDGSSPAARVARTQYPWASVGENLAAGQTTHQEAVDGWLDSPGHCSNLMNPNFTQMGVSRVPGDSTNEYSMYWTQVLARPR